MIAIFSFILKSIHFREVCQADLVLKHIIYHTTPRHQPHRILVGYFLKIIEKKLIWRCSDTGGTHSYLCSHTVCFIDTIADIQCYTLIRFLLLVLDTSSQRSLSKWTFVRNLNEIIQIVHRHQWTKWISLYDLQDWHLSQISAHPFIQYEEESCSPNFDLCMMSVQMTEHMELLCRAI